MPEENKRHYVLWLINAVQDWDKGRLLRALMSTGQATAELGDREPTPDVEGTQMHGIGINDHEAAKARLGAYAGLTEYTAYGALMHEGGHPDSARYTTDRSMKTFDEYFVPIPVKCIGNPDQLQHAVAGYRAEHSIGGATDVPRLQAILAAYPEYFDLAHPNNQSAQTSTYFKVYWDAGLSGAPTSVTPYGAGDEVRMHSTAYVGYYEMLMRWNSRPGRTQDRHILLGYSQGGTVGRFIAYLDEHVFKLNLVHGLVTVQSPNFGSPVACQGNHTQLEHVLLTVLRDLPWKPLVMAFVPKRLKPVGEYLYDCKRNDAITVDDLDATLGTTITKIAEGILRKTEDDVANARKQMSLLIAARKWLSGLTSMRGKEQYAFVDLDPQRTFSASDRVLKLINEAGHSMPHAAVVGCNPSLAALFGDGAMGALIRTVLRSLTSVSLKNLTEKYQTVFDEGAHGMNLTGNYQALATSYNQPYTSADGSFPSRAHDCVIPARYQMMRPSFLGGGGDATRFRGNKINEDANHASGTKLSDKTPNDLELVEAVFRELPAMDP